MSEALITSRTEGTTRIVTINRPQKRNALTPQMLEDLAAAVRAVDESPEIRAVVVAAEGPIFSGRHRRHVAGRKPRLGRRLESGPLAATFCRGLQHALDVIEATEVSVIGASAGQVIGMGLELVLVVRPARGQRRLSVRHSRVAHGAGGRRRRHDALEPDGGAKPREGYATHGPIAGCGRAARAGLVNRVVPAAELLPAAWLAEQIARLAPLAVGMAKLIVDQGDGLNKRTRMALERGAEPISSPRPTCKKP